MGGERESSHIDMDVDMYMYGQRERKLIYRYGSRYIYVWGEKEKALEYACIKFFMHKVLVSAIYYYYYLINKSYIDIDIKILYREI
jgi:hypothetical protein